jgi:excisionase family DNA binding protein
MNLLTTKEVAERLGITTARVCAIISAGRLPAQRFGRAYMIKESDLKLVADRRPGRPVQKAAKKKVG